MYCRICGNLLDDKTEICTGCGCRPLNGKAYCQECGAETTEKQEMCIKCGCRLRTLMPKTKDIFDEINDSFNVSGDETLNLDFSSLPQYYQEEFQKIYESGETYKGKFNIFAFLFGAIWALTKGCWLSAVTCFGASMFTAGIVGTVYWFVFGIRGTYMYYCSYVKNKQCIV